MLVTWRDKDAFNNTWKHLISACQMFRDHHELLLHDEQLCRCVCALLNKHILNSDQSILCSCSSSTSTRVFPENGQQENVRFTNNNTIIMSFSNYVSGVYIIRIIIYIQYHDSPLSNVYAVIRVTC